MTTARIEDVRNFRKIDGRLLTCGQPDEAQLAAARAAGTEVVINLALHDDPRYSLADERGTVEALGMTYRHIPVQFGRPTESDLLAFFDAMDAAGERSVLVHCAANYRVTAFLGLYRQLRQGWAADAAFEAMRTVWTPDATWRAFIESMAAKYGADAATFRHAREIPAPPEAVFDAFANAERLARWWGPDGFTSTFETFEFRNGGRWRFTMHGPDGVSYANESEFLEIIPSEAIRIRHINLPHFELSISLAATPAGTLVSWVGVFDNREFAANARQFLESANEQNLTRLQAEVSRADAEGQG